MTSTPLEIIAFSFYLSAAILYLPWVFKVLCALISASHLPLALSSGILNDKIRPLIILFLSMFVLKSVFVLALFWPIMGFIAWKLGSFNPHQVGEKLINGH